MTREFQLGASIVEFAVCSPVLLVLGLGTVQTGLLYHAKTTINYATFEAARKGAVTHAQQVPMREELGVRLAPLFGGNGKSGAAAKALVKGALAGTDPRFTQLDIISPSQQAFEDWAVYNRQSGAREIPNSHLRQRYPERAAKPNSGVGLQEANLLKIRVIYGYKMTVPLAGRLIARSLLALDPDNARYYLEDRLPISAVATLRMQSPARPDNNASSVIVDADSNDEPTAAIAVFTPVEGVPCDAHGLRSDIDSDSLDLLFHANTTDNHCSGDTTIHSLISASLDALPISSATETAEQAQGMTDCIPDT